MISHALYGKLTNFSMKQSQHCETSAQEYLSIARRRLLLIRTIAKFEGHFPFPLWESEREYLADLLKVKRLAWGEKTIQDPSSCRQRAKIPSKFSQRSPTNKYRVRDDLGSGVVKRRGHRKEAPEEDATETEDEKTEKAIKWLKAEWNSSVMTILRQRDSDTQWDDYL